MLKNKPTIRKKPCKKHRIVKKEFIFPFYFGWQIRVVYSRIARAIVLFWKRSIAYGEAIKVFFKKTVLYNKSINSFYKSVFGAFVIERIKDLKKHIVGPFKEYWQYMTAVVLIIALVSSTLFLNQSSPTMAATYTWEQASWAGAVNTSTFPVHPTNQTGWTDYYAKDINVVAGENLTMNSVSDSWTETSDTDFDGTLTNVQTSGTGDAANLILLSPTTTTTTFSNTDTVDNDGATNMNFDIANEQVKLNAVIPSPDCSDDGTDHLGSNWTPVNDEEIYGKHCNIGIFTIASGTTVYIKVWEASTNYGKLEIEADTINIDGTLDGNGKGYLGGGENGKGTGDGGTHEREDGAGGEGYSSGRGGGGGGYGADGGRGVRYNRGYAYGASDTSEIKIGAGAGGGNQGNTSGGAGGAGGASIWLEANIINISGAVNLNGIAGGNGGDIGGYNSMGGGGGGGGAGGGILINANTITGSGELYVQGGSGGDGGDGYFTGSGGGGGGGGRIKIWYVSLSALNHSESGSIGGSTGSGVVIGGDGSSGGTGTYYASQNKYVSSGTFTSTNLLSGQTVGPIGSFSYNLSFLPANTTVKVSFSQDNTNWFNSVGTASDWDTMSAGNNTISLTALNWTGANFYYKMEFISDGTGTPVLDSVSVHTNYPSTGNLISSIKDTGLANPDFTTIIWGETNTASTLIKFQIKTAFNEEGLEVATWYGPTGTGDYYTSSETAINSIHDGESWIQYKAILETTDPTVTPQLHDVTINWGVASTLTSSPYNTGDAGNIFNKILWTETLPANTDIKFQLRTSTDNSTWTDWCGPNNGEAGCDTTTYFTDPAGEETVDADFADGTGDQWIQYKAFLSSTGANNPVLSDVILQYVINASPVIVTTASQDSDGIINISYTIADEEETSATVSFLADVGVTLNEELTDADTTAITVANIDYLPASGTIQIDNEQISYTSKSGNDLAGTITRGANNTSAAAHSSGATIWIKGTTANVSGDVGSITGLTSTPASKSGTWTIKTDLGELYYATAKIRVFANDGNAANQVGNGDSTTFAIDTKNPVYGSPPLIIDSNASGDTLTNITVTEDSTLSVRYVDASNIDGSTCVADIGSVSYESLVGNSKAWILSPDANGISTVCFQAKDDYGNETAVTFASTPQTVTDAQINDISFPPSSKFKLLVWWGVVPDPGSFSQYNIYRSTNGTDYSLYTTISDRLINYCFDEGDDNCTDDNLGGLDSDTTYYYKIIAQDTDGISSYSSVVSAVPDGSTSGEVDATAPTVTFDETTQGPSLANSSLGDYTASATFSANENAFFSIVYEASTTEPGLYTQEFGVPSLVTTGQESTTSLVGLNENTKYYYKVRTRDISGNIGESAVFSFITTTDTTAPVITFTSATDITSITDSSAIISWTTNEAATLRVDYGTDTSYGSNEANANYNINHSVTLSSLLPETTYYFKITSVDNSISANSATDDNSEAGWTFTTLASSDSTPPVISVVSSGTPSYNTATITWTTDENSSSLVDFGTDTSYGSTQGNSADSTTSHSVVLTGLAPDTTYYYRVKSIDVSGNTAVDDNSEAGWTFLTATASAGDTAPEISSVSSSSITSTSAIISWTTDESSDSTVGFSLNTNFDQEQGSITMTTSHSIGLINLAPETTYYYQVKSRDSAGNLGTDNNSGAGYSFTTLAGGDVLAPIISDVTISDITANTAKISWNTNENSNSLIDYSKTSSVFTSTTGQYQDNTISHSVTLRGLDPSTAYYLQARSIDASSNEGTDSHGGTSYTFTTTAGGDETPPEITSVATGTPTYNRVTITWTTGELSNSLVDFGTSVSYGKTQGDSADSLTSHSVTLTGLTPETLYYYRVKSIDTSGNLASDDNVSDGYYSFTTAAGESTGDVIAPTIVFDETTGITNITSNSATISWTTVDENSAPENADSIVGYSLDTSFNNEKGSASLVTDHSVTLNNLSSGAAYKFQIKSMDNSGNLATENNSGEGYSFTTLAGGDSTAPIISDVSSGTCTDTTCAISWSTDENSSSLVDYGTVQGTYLFTGGNYKDSVTSHSVTLTGLTAETIYYYRVRSIDANNNQATDVGGASGYLFTTTAAEESTCPACPSCGGGGGSSCPSIDTNPPTISDIKILDIASDSARVKWKTDEKANSFVEYGEEDNYGNMYGDYDNTTNHSVDLKWLTPQTTYNYRAASADPSGNISYFQNQSFTTLSQSEQSEQDLDNEIGEITDNQKQQDKEETFKTVIQKAIDIARTISSQMSIASLESTLLFQQLSIEELAKSIPAPLMSGEPKVITTANTAIISWATDKETNSLVAIAPEDKYNKDKENPYQEVRGNPTAKTRKHIITVYDLKPDTTYHYQLKNQASIGPVAESKDFIFKTKEEILEIGSYAVQNVSDEKTIFKWTTSKEADSTIKYIPYRNNILSVDEARTVYDKSITTIHEMEIDGFEAGVTYEVELTSEDLNDNIANKKITSFSTSEEDLPPIIYQTRTESAISPGKDIKVQTIISWITNEPSTTKVYYQEGIATQDKELTESTKLDTNYSKKHIVVITKFKPGSIYSFKAESIDSGGNKTLSKTYTILTPKQKESVFQIIMKNMEDVFGWVGNVR